MFEKINWRKEVHDWLVSIVIAVVIAFLVRTFVVEPYMVEGPSMLPSLKTSERLLVNKFIYVMGRPQKGEIVVFRYPRDPSRDFIKRVIAVGGDSIEIRDGRVYVNNSLQEERYILEKFRGSYSRTIVPLDHVFVMGDNRNNSEDSRYSDVGFVPLGMIKGKAMVVFWPVAGWRLLP